MLQLKLSKVSLSADGTQLVVQDTTGAYNASTNPTGYGAPNRTISTNLILRWKTYNSSVWHVLAGWTGAAYTIDTVKLGLTPTIPGLLPDGVEFVQYLGLYSKGTTVTVIPGSTKILHANLDFTGIDYITFASDLTTIYKIVSRTSTYLILDQCYTGVLSSETIYDAQNADLPVLIQTYTNQQLDIQVAGTSEENMCGPVLDKVSDRLMRSFIAQARFDKTDYYGADIIMQNLFTECSIIGRHDSSGLYC